MANGIPVRLSAELAQRARHAAETSDRSVTEQVEHWARLGQAVEDVALAKTVDRLKGRSHDPALAERIAFASTSDGRAKAVALIKSRNVVRHGLDGVSREPERTTVAPSAKRGAGEGTRKGQRADATPKPNAKAKANAANANADNTSARNARARDANAANAANANAGNASARNAANAANAANANGANATAANAKAKQRRR